MKTVSLIENIDNTNKKIICPNCGQCIEITKILGMNLWTSQNHKNETGVCDGINGLSLKFKECE
jgi:hypothetical protein